MKKPGKFRLFMRAAAAFFFGCFRRSAETADTRRTPTPNSKYRSVPNEANKPISGLSNGKFNFLEKKLDRRKTSSEDNCSLAATPGDDEESLISDSILTVDNENAEPEQEPYMSDISLDTSSVSRLSIFPGIYDDNSDNSDGDNVSTSRVSGGISDNDVPFSLFREQTGPDCDDSHRYDSGSDVTDSGNDDSDSDVTDSGHDDSGNDESDSDVTNSDGDDSDNDVTINVSDVSDNDDSDSDVTDSDDSNSDVTDSDNDDSDSDDSNNDESDDSDSDKDDVSDDCTDYDDKSDIEDDDHEHYKFTGFRSKKIDGWMVKIQNVPDYKIKMLFHLRTEVYTLLYARKFRGQSQRKRIIVKRLKILSVWVGITLVAGRLYYAKPYYLTN